MTIVPALRVLAGLGFTLVVLPRLIFRAPRVATSAIDRLVIDAIRIAALLVVVVHVLVPLQLFQLTGLVLVFALVVYLARLRPAGWTLSRCAAWGARIATGSLYLLEAGSREGNDRVKTTVAQWWRSRVRETMRSPVPLRRRVAVTMLVTPLFIVLAASLALRLYHPLTNAAYPVSDAYVHLAWIKYLYLGELFHDGIYPMGMDAFLGVIAKIFPVAASDVLRFAGPFLNTALVFLLYLVGLRATRNPGASLVGAAVVGIVGLGPGMGLSGYRQVATLPQEFAVLFALAALLMALEYLARPSRSRLLYMGMAGFVSAISHPLAAGVVLLAGAVIGAVAAIASWDARAALRTWSVTIGATLLAYVPVAVAMAAGLETYGRVKTNPVRTGTANVGPTTFDLPAITDTQVGVACVAGAAIGGIVGLALVRRRDRTRLLVPALSLVVLAMAAIQLAADVFLHRWYAFRWTEVTWALMPLGVTLGLAPIGRLPVRGRALLRSGFAVAVGAALAGVMIVQLPPVFASSKFGVEYESEARLLTRIVKGSDKFTYTVVGPPSAYDRVLGVGYHVHLMHFADELEVHDAMDPSFSLPIGTDDVYVFTEKKPFEFDFRGTVRGGVERYFDLDARRRLMNEVDGWMTTYARFHGGASVMYEDDVLRVWKVDHRASGPYATRFALGPAPHERETLG